MSQGTSQNERMPVALDPEYFNVDERSIEDLYEEAQDLAKALAFHDTSAEEAAGTWCSFFEGAINSADLKTEDTAQNGDYPPHIGLFLAFLKLFAYPQGQLNDLTVSHLNFFYTKILGQEKKQAVPDKVFIFFGLAPNVDQFMLPGESVLSAGKDAGGRELLYTTDRQAFLSRAGISDFKAVSHRRNSIVMLPVADSRDGLGEKLEEGEGWKPFGSNDTSGTTARIGFAVASPALLLKEGIRTIHLSLSVEKGGSGSSRFSKLGPDLFEALLTGPDGWIRKEVEAVRQDDGELLFSIRLDESDPPVVRFDQETHGYETDTSEWPILAFRLKEGFTHEHYSFLQSVKISGISIRADVEKARSLLIRNDFGDLEADNAFHPFGYNPGKGANLFLGLEETFFKTLTRLSLKLYWKGLPESLKTYYEGYLGPTNSLVNSNDDFKVKAAIRRRGEWIEITNTTNDNNEFTLFGERLEFDVENPLGQHPDYERAREHKNGLIRLTLSSPDDAFGHKLYPAVYAKAIMTQMKEAAAPIPNEPYTPVIESVEMNYSAEQPAKNFFHVKPFGLEKIQGEYTTLLSGDFRDAGSLYLGIDNLDPPQQLTIFFEMEQEVHGEKPSTSIDYLGDAGWSRLSENQILSDTTLGLKQTGILLLNLPSEMSDGNAAMPTGRHWLRVYVPDHPENFDRILSVRTNAVTCTLKKSLAGESTSINTLPPGRVTTLSKKRSEIKQIDQPYSSFGGRPAEKESDYFTRVSERLKHKNRAVSSWDMERLILDRFPDIYKVNCLPHRNASGRTAPGHVHVIVVPFMKQFRRSNVLKPIVPDSTLVKIKTYVERIASSNASIHVTNPFFDEIKITASVSFNVQVDAGYYVKELQHDLQQFLSPWTSGDETEIQLGSRLYRSSIIEFIESRQYVNFIASIRLLKNGRLVEEEEISPDLQTLIVSSESHDIKSVEPGTITCQTNQGIEQMIVDINFEVQ